MSTLKDAPKRHHIRPSPKKKKTTEISLRRFPVEVYLRDPHRVESTTSERVGAGIVTDITRSGIGVILDQPLPQGTGVVLVLNAHGPNERLIDASALWAKALPCSGHVLKGGTGHGEMWRVGLKFCGLDRAQRSFIEELLTGAAQVFALPKAA